MTRRTIKEDTNSITDAPPTAPLPKKEKRNETKERKRERKNPGKDGVNPLATACRPESKEAVINCSIILTNFRFGSIHPGRFSCAACPERKKDKRKKERRNKRQCDRNNRRCILYPPRRLRTSLPFLYHLLLCELRNKLEKRMIGRSIARAKRLSRVALSFRFFFFFFFSRHPRTRLGSVATDISERVYLTPSSAR